MAPINSSVFESPSRQVRKVKFSHDGSQLLAISLGQITAYDVDKQTSDVIAIKPLIFDAAYLNKQQFVAATLTPERQASLVIYDIGSQRIISTVHVDEEIRSVCVDQQRGRIFTGTLADLLEDHPIVVYDLALNPQSEFKVPNLYMPIDMTISHSGHKLAIAGIVFGVWDISAEPQLMSEECPQESDCNGPVCEVTSGDITPDGRYAVTGVYGAKGAYIVLDGESGKIINWYGAAWNFHTSPDNTAVAISPDGKYVAVVEMPSPTVKVYRVSDGIVSHTYDVEQCHSVAFSPRGNLLAVGIEESVVFWSFNG